MKHIISVGHTSSGNIGCGAVGKLDESNCTREIAPLVVSDIKSVGHDSVLIRVDKSNSYNCEDCYERCEQANTIGGDTFSEIHINAGGDGATGVEVLIPYQNSSMKDRAQDVCNRISSALGIPNRGVKVQNLIVLKRTRMPAMLIECCFNNDPDASKYNCDVIAKCIASGITGVDIALDNSPKLGWNKSADGRWWYCTDVDTKSYYSSSWQYINGQWFLFDSIGWALTGWVYYQTYKDKKDVWYYLDEDCVMAIGWKKVNGEWYYFDASGEMQTDWIKVDGKDYCMYSNGVMMHDIDAYGYHFDSNGVATKL